MCVLYFMSHDALVKTLIKFQKYCSSKIISMASIKINLIGRIMRDLDKEVGCKTVITWLS